MGFEIGQTVFWIDTLDQFTVPVVRESKIAQEFYELLARKPMTLVVGVSQHFPTHKKIYYVLRGHEYITPKLYTSRDKAERACKRLIRKRISEFEVAHAEHHAALKGA